MLYGLPETWLAAVAVVESVGWRRQVGRLSPLTNPL